MSIKAPLLAFACFALGAPVLLAAAPALAGDKSSKTDDTKKSDDDATKDDTKKDDARKDDTKKDADADKPKATAVDDEFDPFEDPSKPYRFIGIVYRDAIAPKFIINWFANGGRNVNVPMVGPQFITRQNHLEIGISLMYADYSMSPFLFQSKSDPSTSWDLIASQLKVGYAMFDIQYEIPLEKRGDKTGRFALLVGGGVGIGGVFGQLYRSQAYPNTPAAANNPGDPSQWSGCTANGKGQPSAYCSPRDTPPYYAGAGGNVYTGSTENSWANGGSKPLVYPWIALPQISFRYKPIKQFQMKADVGFSTTGFFFGASASYGL